MILRPTNAVAAAKQSRHSPVQKNYISCVYCRAVSSICRRIYKRLICGKDDKGYYANRIDYKSPEN